MIQDVCELCDEKIENADEETINYCHKCNEQKSRETDVKNITQIDFPNLKRRLK